MNESNLRKKLGIKHGFCHSPKAFKNETRMVEPGVGSLPKEFNTMTYAARIAWVKEHGTSFPRANRVSRRAVAALSSKIKEKPHAKTDEPGIGTSGQSNS